MDINIFLDLIWPIVKNNLATHDFKEKYHSIYLRAFGEKRNHPFALLKCSKCGFAIPFDTSKDELKNLLFHDNLFWGKHFYKAHLAGIFSCDEYMIKDIIE